MLYQIKITTSPINHSFIIFLCIILLTFFNIDLTAQYSKPKVEFLTVEEGLRHNTVLEIAQDKFSLLWFGTFQGLTRYTGNNFISKCEGLPKTTGRYYDWSIEMDNKSNTKLPDDPYSIQMAIDKAGNIWCVSFGTLYLLELRTDTLYATYKIPFKYKETSTGLTTLLFDSSNELWLRSNEKGVVMLGIDDTTLELIGMANHGLEVIGDPFEVTENMYTII